MSSSVSYSLLGANGKFGVTKEGIIYVNGSLDYEANDMLSFMVRFLANTNHCVTNSLVDICSPIFRLSLKKKHPILISATMPQ